jgi:glycosyltransferase involved in cell wall biosynthesis
LARKDADLYHFHDPELLPIGILLRLAGRRVIYDAHEHVRLSIESSTYLPRWLALPLSWAVRFLEVLISRLGAHVLAATPTISAQFGAGKSTVIGNFPDLVEFEKDKGDHADRDQSVGVYIGGINDERCLEQIFDALESARTRNPNLHLIMAGPVDEVRHPSGIDGIDYRGIVDRPTVSSLMATSAFGLVLLRALPNCVNGLPTKFFEYAAAGTPMIVSASTVNLARIAEQEHCGLVVDETSIDEIASAMLWMLDHPSEARAMGVRARQAVEERYHWGSEARRLLNIYQQRLESGHSRLNDAQ